MSLSKAHQLRGKGQKNKYNARPIQATAGGQGYRSQLEAQVHETLRLMERAGQIRNIRREQSIQIIPSMTHKLDFLVFDIKRNMDIGIEAKGFNDPTWNEKQKVYKDFGTFPVQVWMNKTGRIGIEKEIPIGKYKCVER